MSAAYGHPPSAVERFEHLFDIATRQGNWYARCIHLGLDGVVPRDNHDVRQYRRTPTTQAAPYGASSARNTGVEEHTAVIRGTKADADAAALCEAIRVRLARHLGLCAAGASPVPATSSSPLISSEEAERFGAADLCPERTAARSA